MKEKSTMCPHLWANAVPNKIGVCDFEGTKLNQQHGWNWLGKCSKKCGNIMLPVEERARNSERNSWRFFSGWRSLTISRQPNAPHWQETVKGVYFVNHFVLLFPKKRITKFGRGTLKMRTKHSQNDWTGIWKLEFSRKGPHWVYRIRERRSN